MSALNPVFQSRAEQVLAFLRDRMKEGQWTERLPSERELAQQLGVSRWTLRAAIRELQAEGVIGQRSQAGTKIVRAGGGEAHQLSVGVVLSNKTDLSRRRILMLLEVLRHYLEVQGVKMEVHLVPFPRSGAVSTHFKRLLTAVRHDCWVLVSPLVSMQLWCAEQGGPVVVSGVSDEAAGLPSSSVDFRAVCRHAAGLLIGRGHRRLAMILAEPLKSEDALSRRGFEEGVREHGCPEDAASVRYEGHDQTHEGVKRLVDRMLAMRDRPTAWLVCRQASFTKIYTYLLYRGVRIPEEVALLCRDSDDYFDDFLPAPAFYRAIRRQLVQQTARLAIRVALGQAQPGEAARLMPEFIPGKTI